jgi:flavin-dependent dehydrogenase
MHVAIIDKRQFPRDKTCAGWITPQVVETLELDVADYGQTRVCQPITGFRTGMLGAVDVEDGEVAELSSQTALTPVRQTHGKRALSHEGRGRQKQRDVEVGYDHPVSYGIRRCEFDHYLLERCGAECLLGAPIQAIERSADRWIINGAYEAPLLIGAGGHFCPIAQRLGARQGRRASVVAAQEIEFLAAPADLAQSRIEPETPELYFCDDLLGYGWCFRKGDYLNIGLGRVEAKNLTRHVEAFCNFLRERDRYQGEMPVRFHGHAYQLYERTPPKLIDDGVLLIGDAAGLAYPQSGEGIRPAVESALLAADVILSAGEKYGRERLRPYEKTLSARFGPLRNSGLADRLPVGWLHFLARRLMATRWFARRVVLERWFLHMDEPPLRPLALPAGASR